MQYINIHYMCLPLLLYIHTKHLNSKDVCSERLAELWMIQYQHCIDELEDIILQSCIVCNVERYQHSCVNNCTTLSTLRCSMIKK